MRKNQQKRLQEFVCSRLKKVVDKPEKTSYNKHK